MNTQEKWDQLPAHEQQRLLDAHRDANVFDDWFEFTYNDFKGQMASIGVRVDQIYFSGFWSQGDGACFEGAVEDWGKFLAATGSPELAELYDPDPGDADPHLSWCHSGRYYHEYCTSFDAALAHDNPYDEGSQPLRHAAWAALHGEDGPLVPMEDDFIGFLRDKMRELYRALEAEYDYLTSDERVLEHILDYCEDEIDEALTENELDLV